LFVFNGLNSLVDLGVSLRLHADLPPFILEVGQKSAEPLLTRLLLGPPHVLDPLDYKVSSLSLPPLQYLVNLNLKVPALATSERKALMY
jgi:hypothetical protein